MGIRSALENWEHQKTWVGNYWAVLFKCPKGHRQGDRDMVVWEKSQVACVEEAQTLELDRIHKKVTETHREEESWLWCWWKGQTSDRSGATRQSCPGSA